MNYVVRILTLLVMVLSLAVCGGDAPPQQAQTSPAARSAPQPEPQPVEPEEEEEPEPTIEYTYDASIRDPFQPVDLGPERSARPDCGALCNFDVGQFRLIGIVWGISEPVAMLRAPDGKPHVAKVGMPIGQNNGNIVSIANDRVAVLEKYVNYRGEVVSNRIDIELPAEGGNRR